MLLLSANHICKNHGLKVILDNVTLNIQHTDKIGLVGINGTGKSTLLKILSGFMPADSGEIQTSNQLVIEYLPQDPVFDEDATVLQQIFRGTSPFMQVLRDYEETVQLLEQNPTDEKLTQRLMQLNEQMDEHNAWQLESEAKAILNKLGIHQFDAKVSTMSGGQRKRIALAGALIRPCNLLILDEPTNHLDNDMIEYLEELLKNRNCAVLMVTHDRYFLDRITNHIVELDKGKLYTYEGNYERFLELKLQREQEQQRIHEKERALYKQELAWMRKGVEARRTKQKARIEKFHELEDNLASVQEEKKELSFQHSRLGKKIIEMEHIKKSFGDKACINDLTYHVVRDDRIGIIGDNGLGKSTLLNIIAGKLQADSGTLEIGDTVKIGYYTQDNRHLPLDMKIIDYIREKGEYIHVSDGTLVSAARMLERFSFSSAQQYSLIGSLSGGEKRSLYLLGVLMEDVNVLLLDEPTNDLDIQTLQILEDFLDHFAGPVITVSHDRYFLDRTCHRIFAFEGNGVVDIHVGNYSDYAERKATQEPVGKVTEATAVKEKSGDTRVRQEKIKFTYNEQKEFDTIEDDIAKLEEKIAACEQAMLANSTDFVKLNDLTKEKEQLEEQLLLKMERWEYLTEKHEQIQQQKK
ncbi:MAG: ABC-F family ATP-binding cassette domain-containing protein [Peptococcaceae bacterium]|nr:ABC-F family ATP-binding cassette domain-containing protein [Peptococcaceae bacterium]